MDYAHARLLEYDWGIRGQELGVEIIRPQVLRIDGSKAAAIVVFKPHTPHLTLLLLYTPYTLHTTPHTPSHTLPTTSYTPYPTLYTVHLTPYTLHPESYNLRVGTRNSPQPQPLDRRLEGVGSRV